MKRVVLAVVLVLILAGAVGAVPYPYGDYELDTSRDPGEIYKEIEQLYQVRLVSESGNVYPWSELSFATLSVPILVEADVNREAEHKFLTSAEKEQELKQQFAWYIDDIIHFWALLVADPDVSYGYRYVDPDSTSTYLTRIVLETSDGQRYTPVEFLSGGADLVAGYWLAVTSISFPKYDKGVQIINEDTEWVRLWFITGTDRAYFQFDFEH